MLRKGEPMQKRKFDEIVSYCNKKVSEMEIETKYKMELLGMVTALGYAHEKETHEERTETHACDCISRQEAITTIQEAYADTEGGTDKCAVWKNVGLTNALHIMQDMPSAQPYTEAEIQKMQDLEQAEIQKAYELGKLDAEQRWIPCKTALPEKGQYVLCQCRVGIMDVLHLTDDNGWYKDSTHIYMYGFVLAWMPLPEPYREEGEKQ